MDAVELVASVVSSWDVGGGGCVGCGGGNWPGRNVRPRRGADNVRIKVDARGDVLKGEGFGKFGLVVKVELLLVKLLGRNCCSFGFGSVRNERRQL